VRALDSLRDPQVVLRAVEALHTRVSRRWSIMEVCGGQTHGLLASGLLTRLEPVVGLLHGPGCPVCVTPVSILDRAIELALRPGVTLCTFGDMLRVPGSRESLQQARTRGADLRVVYSPLDAARLAEREPGRSIVFLAVGFETTAPAVAVTLRWARRRALRNFHVLVAHVRLPPALAAIRAGGASSVDAFLAAGHVCTVMGTGEYESIARLQRVPIVVTGFEPVDLVDGIARAVEQLERGQSRVEIQYTRAVRPEGNPAARACMEEVFEVVDREWRGIGIVAGGGLGLRDRWTEHDAERLLPSGASAPSACLERGECRASEVLRGVLHPPQCAAFGTRCTPVHPLGAPMVSAEGACAAYFLHGKLHAAAGAI
jgi:hydrogenase expression/formation protein HypD